MDKNPKRVEAGKKAAATRWGEPRVARLDDLTPAQRKLVMALIDAQEEANRKVVNLADLPPAERAAVQAIIDAKKKARKRAEAEG